jgi:hypothetical protein
VAAHSSDRSARYSRSGSSSRKPCTDSRERPIADRYSGEGEGSPLHHDDAAARQTR